MHVTKNLNLCWSSSYDMSLHQCATIFQTQILGQTGLAVLIALRKKCYFALKLQFYWVNIISLNN